MAKKPPPVPSLDALPGKPPREEILLFSRSFSESFREQHYRFCDPIAVEIWLKLMGEKSLAEAIDKSAQWDVPAPNVNLRKNRSGAALGLDFGGTQLKVVGLEDGIWKAEVLHPWQPDRFQTFQEFEKALESVLVPVLKNHPGLQSPLHFGISCAGVIRNERIVASNLFRGIPEALRERELSHFLIRQAEKWCPVGTRFILGDGMAMGLGAGLEAGDATRSQAITVRQGPGAKARLVFALGTSVACGFYDPDVAWENYLNEISFLPFDPKGQARDPWSRRKGTLSQMVSGTWVRRALESGMNLPLVYEELGSRWKPLLASLTAVYPKVEEVVFLGGALSPPGARENFLKGLEIPGPFAVRIPTGFSRDLPYLAALGAALYTAED